MAHLAALKKARYGLAFAAGKATRAALRLLGRNATQFPGEVALKICPDFFAFVPKPATIIAVTGTNGKTTCSNLIAQSLAAMGKTVLNNSLGSNTRHGIASALLHDAKLTGGTHHDVAVLEVDERSSHIVYQHITPDYLLCTNLMRDSIHRNAHPEFIFNLIDRALPPSTTLVLNADDGISSQLGARSGNPRVFYGINQMPSDSTIDRALANDLRVCPRCGAVLHYLFIRQNQIGRFRCEQCGFASQKADYAADISLSAGTLQMRTPSGAVPGQLVSSALFDAYNQVGALALLATYGIPTERAMAALESQRIVQSRHTSEKIGDITVTTNAAKGMNPVAASWVFDYLRFTSGTKEVILLMGEVTINRVSSENICWLYDADFEFLRSPDIHRIIVGGPRRRDFQVRMLLAGIPPERIVSVERDDELPQALQLDCEQIFLLHDIDRGEQVWQLLAQIKARLREKAQLTAPRESKGE